MVSKLLGGLLFIPGIFLIGFAFARRAIVYVEQGQGRKDEEKPFEMFHLLHIWLGIVPALIGGFGLCYIGLLLALDRLP